jgi:tRNA threonylcarbamoyl adenosine modification protein (Sua5/YciO/YrdC/YwlC family)
LKENLPGPFTFILNASSQVPKIVGTKKKQVGIRVPDNQIVQKLLESIENPLISTSIHSEDEIQEYLTDPEDIIDAYVNRVDLIIDGGAGKNKPSTVIDCTGAEPVVIREGLGVLA